MTARTNELVPTVSPSDGAVPVPVDCPPSTSRTQPEGQANSSIPYAINDPLPVEGLIVMAHPPVEVADASAMNRRNWPPKAVSALLKYTVNAALQVLVAAMEAGFPASQTAPPAAILLPLVTLLLNVQTRESTFAPGVQVSRLAETSVIAASP